MNNYINEHKRNFIVEYKKVPWASLKVGDIIKIYYPKTLNLSGIKYKINNKNPHILILNKFHKGLVHALVIDYISTKELKKFKEWILKEYQEKAEDDPNKKIDSAFNYLSKKVSNPLTFYNTQLSKYLTSNNINQEVYRTYYYIGIRSVNKAIVNWSQL